MKKNTPIEQRKTAMNVSLIRLSVALLGMAIPSILYAANLKDMDVVSLPGERVELKLMFDEPVAAPNGYTIDQPARIALDLPGVTSQLGEKRRAVGIGNVRNLTVVESKNVTRLVVGLNTLVPYTTRAEGNNIFIILGDKTTASPVAQTNTASTVSTKPTNNVTPVTTKAVTSVGNAIENIDFRRGDNGEGNIVVKLSNSTISPDVQEKGGKIVLNFLKHNYLNHYVYG